MLSHFAITPDVFEPAAVVEMNPPGVVLLELLRRISEHGLLANLDAGRWMTEVLRHQRDKRFPQGVRDLLETLLKHLSDHNRLITHPPGTEDFAKCDFRWLRWSVERHRFDNANPLDGVFSTDDYIDLSGINDDIFVRLSGALYSPCWNKRESTPRFAKTIANFERFVTPVVRYARKVTLVDQFMNCRLPRFLRTVEHCSNLLGDHDGNQTPGVIHIHAGDPEKVGPDDLRESVRNRLNRWKAELEPFASHWGHSFRVFLWGRRDTGMPLHDRYIITDQCGIKAPGGLDFSLNEDESKAILTTWSLLAPDASRKILMEEYHRSKSPYRYLKSLLVEP